MAIPFSFSVFPDSWKEILQAPVFIISQENERFSVCKSRAERAGFLGNKISRSYGINRDNQEEIDKEWNEHPFLPSNRPFGKHPAAVMLAHLRVWKNILEKNIPYAVIFEDDMLFHTSWDSLAPLYYKATPKGCDMIFMGHHCGNVDLYSPVVMAPVYCLNAYILTYNGAKKLYKMITQYPYEDFGVVDMMLVRLQGEVLRSKNPYNYMWYAWNSQMFPDPSNERYKHPESLKKDMGLVFQQFPFFKLD